MITIRTNCKFIKRIVISNRLLNVSLVALLVAQLTHKKQQNPEMVSQLETLMEQENFKMLHKETLDLPLGIQTKFFLIHYIHGRWT